jgi:hypothetical protein
MECASVRLPDKGGLDRQSRQAKVKTRRARVLSSQGSGLRGDIRASGQSDDIASHAGTIESPQAEDSLAGCGQCILYADLEEDVYMTPPPGMNIKWGYCLKPDKSLYGLKQAQRNWNKNIIDQITSMGFKQCMMDNCLFVKEEDDATYLISLYVDDILVAGTNERKIEDIKHEFTTRYEMKDLGELNYYLGMKVTRTAEYVKLDQHRYCLDIAAGSGEQTPMERDLKLRKFES